MVARERKSPTKFLQRWKLNKNIMNNENFGLSQWANNAVQEAGREKGAVNTLAVVVSSVLRNDQEIVLFQEANEMAMQLGWKVFTEKSPDQTLWFHLTFCTTRAMKWLLIGSADYCMLCTACYRTPDIISVLRHSSCTATFLFPDA